MKIGLINIEPKVVNTAMMQISYHHKRLGHVVEWAEPLVYGQFDWLYCSSLFNFTDKSQLPARTIKGGTGFDLTTTLPFDCDYDYSIYPNCDYSILWFSRGCIRNCPFCVVQKKEGYIRSVENKPLNPKGKYIVVQDNSFFANPQWKSAIVKLKRWNQPIAFNAGIDGRILTDEHCESLASLKLKGEIYLAWDNPKEDLIPAFELITKYIKPYKIACYVLIGYWSTPEQDLYRVEMCRKYKIEPFVMPYNKKDPYQKRFARYVDHKAIFKSVKWENYNQEKRKVG